MRLCSTASIPTGLVVLQMRETKQDAPLGYGAVSPGTRKRHTGPLIGPAFFWGDRSGSCNLSRRSSLGAYSPGSPNSSHRWKLKRGLRILVQEVRLGCDGEVLAGGGHGSTTREVRFLVGGEGGGQVVTSHQRTTNQGTTTEPGFPNGLCR